MYLNSNSFAIPLLGDPSLLHHLQSIYARSRVHTTLDAHFFLAAARYHPDPQEPFPLDGESPSAALAALQPASVLRTPLGGGTHRRTAVRYYTPLLERKRLDPVEVANERWRVGKGGRRKVKESQEVNGDADE